MHRSVGRRGSMVMTLIITSMVITLAFVCLSSMLFSLSNVSSYSRAQGCQLLAESAIQKAIAQIQNDPNFGSAPADSVNVSLPSLPGGTGRISFGAEPGLVRSTNNLSGTANIAAEDGTAVPPMCIRLVAKGTCGSETKQIDVMLQIPKYPYVISSNSPIYSTGGLVVQGVTDDADLDAGLGAIPPEKLKPGHVFSNSDLAGGSKAISLVGAEVSGDVKAVGDAVVSGGSNVVGQVISQASKGGLPEIPLTDFDTASKNGVVTITSGTTGAVSYSGYNRRQGDLIVQGALTLEKAVIYVDGNVVTEGLSGEGAIVATGKVTISKGGTFTGSQEIAILAGSDISLEGTPGTRAEFRGLLYSKGKMRIKEVNLAGVVISNDPSGGKLEMENSLAIHNPGSAFATSKLKSVVTGGGMISFTIPGDPPTTEMIKDDVHYAEPATLRIYDPGTQTWVPTPRNLLNGTQQAILDQIYQDMYDANSNLQAATTGQTPGTPVTVQVPVGVDVAFGETWTLDLNKFIKLGENLKIVSWKVK